MVLLSVQRRRRRLDHDPRSRDVYICNGFATTLPGWVTVIHEALHEAGRDESGGSASINALVQNNC